MFEFVRGKQVLIRIQLCEEKDANPFAYKSGGMLLLETSYGQRDKATINS